LRRARETIGDLDLLATSEVPSRAAESFVGLSGVREVLNHGSKKASVRLDSGMQIDLRIVPEESFGAALQYFTGSKAHNIALRRRAVAKGWKLNEYGLTDENGRQVAGVNEEGIYRALGLAFIPPELREDDGEIQAAERNEIPTLVEQADLHGDLHVHTEASDGQASLAEMVAAARQRGLKHIAITDHARFAEVIGGLTPDGIRRQIDEIEALNETLKGFRVLTGIEANIQADGSLDVEDALLKRLDVVIASLHGQFRQTERQMTERLLRACRNEHVDIIGHPTGRKIGERRPVAADWDAVFEAAAGSGTAMEVNANPIRLDLSASLVRRALQAGCRLAIGSDAHKPEHFDYLRLGILTARRGWARAEDLLLP
jgi:DNA polymerase (family 10)